MNLEEKIRNLLTPILGQYVLSVPDMVAIARYRLGEGEIDREDVVLALRNTPPMFHARYAPYYDAWRPPPHIRGKRRDYINSLPMILRRLIVAELTKYVRDETLWRRHHVYQEYIDEVDAGW